MTNQEKLLRAMEDIKIFSIGRSKMLCGQSEWNDYDLAKMEEYLEMAKSVILELANLD